MTREQFASRLLNACASVMAAEQELTEIDSKFGDADHGLTMAKIARAITEAVEDADGGIQTMLDDAAMAVMSLNGGSAVPLWNTWLDGLQEEAPEGEEIDVPGIQTIFAKALEELNEMSGAQVGDKIARKATQELDTFSQLLAGWPVHTVLLWGSPGPEIVHFAREGKFDALVMTRSTRGPLQKLGSVATYLVRNAQFLDLIIMRENEE